jgi:hypothetical protein
VNWSNAATGPKTVPRSSAVETHGLDGRRESGATQAMFAGVLGCPARNGMGRQPLRRIDARDPRPPTPRRSHTRGDLRNLCGGTAARPAHRGARLRCVWAQVSGVDWVHHCSGGNGGDAVFTALRCVAGRAFDRRDGCGPGNELLHCMGLRSERSRRCSHRRNCVDRRFCGRPIRCGDRVGWGTVTDVVGRCWPVPG